MDKFDSILSSVIDSHLGLRSKLVGYQYSEIIRAVFSVFYCGGGCMEDLNLYLKDVLTERPHTRVPSADTVLRGIEELATENISYTAEKTGNAYDFNTAEKLNQLLIKLLLATGQLTEGGEYDVDFDHQFLEAEKYDSKRTYKGFDGYSPGVFTIGGLIAYLENCDGNANVRFMQAETHRRFFEMMKSFGIHVRSFRADCGSYSEDIVRTVMEHTDKFYIRAGRHAALYEKVKRQTGWSAVEIGFQQYDVQSFPFESFEGVKHCRLVVQRQRKQKGEQLDIFDGEYTYRCILTNDWDMTDEDIIRHYNKRGSAEQVFDRQNNDFGWAHLPKSFMNQNTVFLLFTAMAANFTGTSWQCRSWQSSLVSRPQTGSRASCSGSSPFLPSGSERQDNTNSTSTPTNHTTLFGNTGNPTSFVDDSVYASRPYGVRGSWLMAGRITRLYRENKQTYL